MVDALLHLAGTLYAGWVLGNVALFLLGAWLVVPEAPTWNGFRVHIPPNYMLRLTQEELAAIVEHELGHKRCGHVWKNLARRCCCLPLPEHVRVRQELEADDCVTRPWALASALRKLSNHPFDLLRAARLEERLQHLAGGMPA